MKMARLQKKSNYDEITLEIEKLDFDQQMAKEQLDVFQNKHNDLWKLHPSFTKYQSDLKEEISEREKQRITFVEKQKEFKKLADWSAVIVKVCQWLEANMEDFCINELKLDIPKDHKINHDVFSLTQEQRKEFAKGLSEITYNLAESQDFFGASVDGRLNKYHNLHKEMALAQLEVLKKYPEESARRQHIENELLKDLEFVDMNVKEDSSTLKRRQKMLDNHKEFFKVLSYYKKKLGIDDPDEMVYDPKYDHFQKTTTTN